MILSLRREEMLIQSNNNQHSYSFPVIVSRKIKFTGITMHYVNPANQRTTDFRPFKNFSKSQFFPGMVRTFSFDYVFVRVKLFHEINNRQR